MIRPSPRCSWAVCRRSEQNLDDAHVRRALQEMGRKCVLQGVYRHPAAFCAILSRGGCAARTTPRSSEGFRTYTCSIRPGMAVHAISGSGASGVQLAPAAALGEVTPAAEGHRHFRAVHASMLRMRSRTESRHAHPNIRTLSHLFAAPTLECSDVRRRCPRSCYRKNRSVT